jgi:hypothetical protein
LSFTANQFGDTWGVFGSVGTFGGEVEDTDTVLDEIPFRRPSGSFAPIALAGGKVPFLNSAGAHADITLATGKVSFLNSAGTHTDITLV